MSVGRPRKEISREIVEEMCHIQCTAVEISGVLGCSPDLIDLRCKEWGYANFSEFYKEYSAGGKKSLRRAQFDSALKGNAALLIWLGKQYLGQKDIAAPSEEEVYEEPESLKEA